MEGTCDISRNGLDRTKANRGSVRLLLAIANVFLKKNLYYDVICLKNVWTKAKDLNCIFIHPLYCLSYCSIFNIHL